MLKLVHKDVYGPMEAQMFRGAQHFVTFIDDYSGKLWVYMIKEQRLSVRLFSLVSCNSNTIFVT